MRTNTALQVIFAFFLGLVVVAFVGIGVNTFYSEPAYVDGRPSQYVDWQLTTGIILLVCATVILAISLFLPELQAVLSNGILLGGVFTMIYAVGVTVSSNSSIVRFIVVQNGGMVDCCARFLDATGQPLTRLTQTLLASSQ